jgi:hypothetical protein
MKLYFIVFAALLLMTGLWLVVLLLAPNLAAALLIIGLGVAAWSVYRDH